jgi:hypothetical protein
MRTILLIMIGVSSLMASSFSRNANGMVTDSRTNLEWQDDYSDNSNDIKNTTWQSAIDYCENLNLDGKSDWRLPNLNELTSLVDDTRFDPSINSSFQNTNSYNYWSSSSYSGNNGNAWIVNFNDGFQNNNGKVNNGYVRCVRAGQ